LFRNSELYRGRRRPRRWLNVLLIVLLVLIALAVFFFFTMQKYIVYTQDGIKVEFPILQSQNPTDTLSEEDAGDTDLVVESADDSNLVAVAGNDLSGMKGIYISYSGITPDNIQACANRLTSDENALVLQMKTSSGQLSYKSSVKTADSFGVNGTSEIADTIASIKEDKGSEIWLVAQLSCCVDTLMAQRNSPVALKSADGSSYTDSSGGWIDPYNSEYRTYIVNLATELYGMGFDEILLSDVTQPNVSADQLSYSGTSADTSSTESAVTNFAVAVSRSIRSLGARVSAVAMRSAIVQSDEGWGGQNIEVFCKMFDRIYCYTDSENYELYQGALTSYITVGNVQYRFVPIYSGTVPDTECWVTVG